MAHSSLADLDHRPWPLPKSPWIISQRWSNLLFAHWRLPLEQVQSLIPKTLEIDRFDGSAWIGIVPFELRIRPRGLPVVPRIAAFAEINVRTYVTHQGKPGVWFFSLDATSPLAVRMARRFFRLPYFLASIQASESDAQIEYRSARRTNSAAVNFVGRYRPISDVFQAQRDSLEAWLTERYCLYAIDPTGRPARTDVHHKPWPLQHAECEIEENSMTAPLGIELVGQPLLHFAKRIDVVNWLPQQLQVA